MDLTKHRSSWLATSAEAVVDAWERTFGDRAATIAFYGMLSMFPTVLVVLIVAITLGSDPTIFDQWMAFAARFLPDALISWVERYLADLVSAAGVGIFSLSFVSGLWFATMSFDALLAQVRFAYMLKRKPTWKVRLYGFVLMFYTLLAGLIALQAIAFGRPLIELALNQFDRMRGLIGVSLQIFRWTVALSLAYSIAHLTYYIACEDELPKRSHTVGAVAFALLWALLTRLMVVYFQYFRTYQEIFGAIGAMIVTMTWLYMVSWAILLGADINRILLSRRRAVAEVSAREPVAEATEAAG